MSSRTCFKVVRNLNGRRVSAVADPPFSLEYEPGRWTESKVGGILVFDYSIDAVGFSYCVQNSEIWIAEVSDPVELPPYGLMSEDFREKRLLDLWVRKKYNRFRVFAWPPGTAAFKRCMLSMLVKPMEVR
jgi:hypothetical protein